MPVAVLLGPRFAVMICADLPPRRMSVPLRQPSSMAAKEAGELSFATGLCLSGDASLMVAPQADG
jgi:hypothetical protein